MDTAAILRDLTHFDGLPRTALQAASERRDELAPVLIGEIENYLAKPAGKRGEANPLFFAFHLMGDWKEKAAYRPLARLMRVPEAELEEQLGYSVSETAHRVMASVYDGDPQPLFDIVLDPQADEFGCSRMLETLAMLALRGDAMREVVVAFLREGFSKIQPQEACFVWQGWQSAIAMLGLSELKPLVKEAFDRGFIDPSIMSFGDFEKDLELGIVSPGKPRILSDEYLPFGNTIDELSSWYCFSEQYKVDRARRAVQDDSESESYADLLDPQRPAVNLLRDVGRNDLCPCGSGKKYKRCCLH